MNDNKYSRVYWGVVDDDRFIGIYDDDSNWSAYTRLLMIADQAWPASAHLPATLRKSSLSALIERGIVEPGTSGRFRIHGMDAERERRSEAGRLGGIASGRSRQSLNGRSSNVQPEFAKPLDQSRNLDEERRDETRREDQEHPAALEMYAQLVSRPSAKAQSWLDRLVSTYGDGSTTKAIQDASAGGIRDLLSRTETLLSEAKGKSAASRRWEKSQANLREYRDMMKPPEDVA